MNQAPIRSDLMARLRPGEEILWHGRPAAKPSKTLLVLALTVLVLSVIGILMVTYAPGAPMPRWTSLFLFALVPGLGFKMLYQSMRIYGRTHDLITDQSTVTCVDGTQPALADIELAPETQVFLGRHSRMKFAERGWTILNNRLSPRSLRYMRGVIFRHVLLQGVQKNLIFIVKQSTDGLLKLAPRVQEVAA